MKIAAEADLTALTTDELHCFRYTSSCSDKKLRDKLLKIEDPTLQELNRAIRIYERVNATNSALDDEKHNAQVKQIKKQNQQHQQYQQKTFQKYTPKDQP